MKIPIHTIKPNKLKKVVHKLHVLTIVRPRRYLLQRSSLYSRWHSFRFRKHIHVILGTLASLAIVFVIVGLISHNALPYPPGYKMTGVAALAALPLINTQLQPTLLAVLLTK